MTIQHDRMASLHFGAWWHGLNHLIGQTEHKEMPRSQMKYKQSLLHAGQFSLASDYDLHSHVILV